MNTKIKKMMFKRMMFVAVLLLSLAFASSSQAVPLTAFGPRDLPITPGTGFPLWYQDSNGVSIGQCDDAVNGFCILLADEFFNPALPLSFPTNFPGETFYYLAETFAGPLFYRVAVETGFAGLGAPADGQQAVFSRVRFRANVDVPGVYTVTHPYGVETFNVTAIIPGPEINQTLDVFGLVPLSFNGPTDPSSTVGPFLKNVAGNVTDPANGKVYLANPAASVAVTGSPFGTNLVSIVGPGLNATATTFNLQGRVIGNVVTPTSLTFPTQKTAVASAAQTVTVTNISATAPLTTQVTIDGANAADFALATDTCSGVAVPASGTCTFGVVFNGAAPTPAARTASALVTTVTPTGMPPMRVALNGTIDSVPPTVILKVPADGQTVPANSSIFAVFSEPMLASTITSTTFTLTSGGAAVTGIVTYDAANKTATLVPANQLLPVGVGNTATITTGAADAAGNPVAANVVWSFATVAADFTRPTVASTSPARNALGVRLDAPIKVTFDDTMNAVSINAGTFTVSGGITGSVTFDAATKTATFTPSTSLAAGSAFTVTIKGGAGGVDDWAQNTMLADFQFSFVTNHHPSHPALSSPADGATGLQAPVTMKWAKSTDDDNDTLEYFVEVCNNQFFIGCQQQAVPLTAGAPRLNSAYFAGLGGLGMAVIGLVSIGGIRGRKRFLMLMIVVLLMGGVVISACKGKTETETVTTTTPSAAEVSFTATNLNAGALYFWRVEVRDPNGGADVSEIRSFRTQ
jgi:hypothetical protein